MNTKTQSWAAILTIAALCLFTAAPAVADWFEGEPAKWVQLPDFDPISSIDVRAGFGRDGLSKTLADDFLCTETGLITDIHIWGSWRDDILPQGDPSAVEFTLSLYKDIPATPDNHSMPEDPPIWEGFFGPGQFAVRDVAQTPQGWYDPNTNEFQLFNHFRMWQYNFDLTTTGVVPPMQTGTAENPVVYWLGVTAFPMDTIAEFGWKSSPDHWNDDAVWRDDNVGAIRWEELRYPLGHPFAGRSIDLAFVVVPEPTTVSLLALASVAAVGLLRRRI